MAWDSSRPVPWQRLIKEWLIYVAIMAALFIVFFRDRDLVGIFAGLLVSGPLFLLFGYGMAKFGYQRKSFKQLRNEPRAARPKASDVGSSTDGPRPKPAPTKRTGGGGGRPGGQRTKRGR